MKILFICRYNRFRSQIAEAYFRKINKNKSIYAESAGIEYGIFPLDSLQVKMSAKNGIVINKIPNKIDFKKINSYDKIIIVANDVNSNLFNNLATDKIERWEIEDEKNGRKEKIKIIIEEIKKRVKKLIQELEEFPKVSIIIPIYNSEKYITETVASVLNQTYQNLEIIAYDDCSLDRSYSIIKDFSRHDNRIKIFKNNINSGKAKTVNNAFKKVSGEYVCILDSDDLFIENKIEKQIKFLKKNNKIDLVYSDMLKFDNSGTEEHICAIRFKHSNEALERMKTKARDVPNWVQRAYRILMGKMGNKKYIPASSVMFRRKIIDSGIKMDPKLRNSEDYDFWLNIIGHKHRIQKLNCVTYKYRIHDSQKSSNSEKMQKATQYIINKLKSGKYFK